MVNPSAANLAWLTASAPAWAAFSAALDDPAREQEKILRRYLKNGAQSAFGLEHGLAEIRTYEQFSERVPIRNYDELEPWITRVRLGEQRVLTAEAIDRLVPTGGSTAACKLIPYTAESHDELNRAVGPWIYDLYRHQPRAFGGPAYWSVTPLTQNEKPSQISAVPVGFEDDSAYLGNSCKRAVDAAMAVPGELKHISSIEVLRYVTLLLLLRCRDLSLISIWHPSFFNFLFDAMPQQWDHLTADIAGGGCAVLQHVPPTLRSLVQSPLDPDRARKIRRAGPKDFTKLWPMLALVSCWADGHAASAAAALSALLPSVTIQPKGLLATEGVISIPFDNRHPLAIRSHFYEFIDEDGNIALASDLQPEQTYNVVLTTAGGLWRYRLHDLILVTGMSGRTPSVRFVGKSGLVSDRRGEKLSDGFVTAALARLFTKHPPQPSFALLALDADAHACRYTLYINSDVSSDLCRSLDDQLRENPQYAYCRALGQLNSAVVFRVRGDAYSTYCDRLLSLGQRLGDIKPASLSLLDNWSGYFTGQYIQSPGTASAEPIIS